MFDLNKICVATFISLLALACCNEQALEITDVQMNTVETNPANVVTLTKLSEVKSESGDFIYTFYCVIGSYFPNRLACAARDSKVWPSAQDVELNLRCPRSGSGPILSTVEITFSALTTKVNCFVNEGSIGSGYIGVTVDAWNTASFNYTANFYY